MMTIQIRDLFLEYVRPTVHEYVEDESWFLFGGATDVRLEIFTLSNRIIILNVADGQDVFEIDIKDKLAMQTFLAEFDSREMWLTDISIGPFPVARLLEFDGGFRFPDFKRHRVLEALYREERHEIDR